MRKLFYSGLLLLFFLWGMTSCKDPLPANGSQSLTLNLTKYMNPDFCSEFFEGAEKDIRVYVYRDHYQGGGVVSYNVSAGTYYLTNDMDDSDNTLITDPDRFGIPAEIPQKGTYALRVAAKARDCYVCCDGPSCPGTEGEPQYLSAHIEFNRTSNPSWVMIVPNYDSCE